MNFAFMSQFIGSALSRHTGFMQRCLNIHPCYTVTSTYSPAAGAGGRPADQYGEKAGEGMKADAEEMKEQEKMLREELTEARRRERKELEKRLKEEASGSEAGVSEGSDHCLPCG